jgi:hypothetical protein
MEAAQKWKDILFSVLAESGFVACCGSSHRNRGNNWIKKGTI